MSELTWEVIGHHSKESAKASVPVSIATFRRAARKSDLFDMEDLRNVGLMLVTFGGGLATLEDNQGNLWYVHVHGLEAQSNG